MKFKNSSNQRAYSIFEAMETNEDSGEKERLRFYGKMQRCSFLCIFTASENSIRDTKTLNDFKHWL